MEILSKIPTCCWIAIAIVAIALIIAILLLSAGSDENDHMGRG